MRFALSLPNAGPPGRLIDIAVAAESSGWDGVFLWDHLQLFRTMRLELHDPWVLLGAIARTTESVRLGTLITPISRRRIHKFAKEVVTLDHLSHGRVTVGIGLGFPDDEFAAFGEPAELSRRAAFTDEALPVLVALWSGEPVNHAGPFLTVDAHFRPATVQTPHPPVWVACLGKSRGAMRRALRWNGIAPLSPEGQPLDAESLADIVTSLDQLPTGFDVVAAWGSEPAEAYEEAGATWLVESRWPEGNWLDELQQRAESGPLR